MKRDVIAALVLGAAMGSVALPAAGGQGKGEVLGARLVTVAQAGTFQERKQAYLIDVEREASILAREVGTLSQLYPTEGGTNAAFAGAKRGFDEKLAALRAQVAVLRATPADQAQATMDDVDGALGELRTAYSRVTDAAK
ncbi:MAG: hypothetical protein IH608_01135 [Proteobacteria bacterium]|nr:hypothetical protein [Pseudomonadota bacterium]